MNDSNALAVSEQGGALAPRETDQSAGVARAKAEVEARYIVAQQRPRSWDSARANLMRECQRTRFAEVAMYELPRAGTKIRGLSIRFAESAQRIAGNMMTQVQPVYEDSQAQQIRVSAIDLETNAIIVEDLTIPKFQERRRPRRGEEVISSRQNSTGEMTYKIRTTDDDYRTKRRSETQRARRNAILALIPGDILEDCMAEVRRVREADVASDPEAHRKKILDSFAILRVPISELRDYLGHEVDSASPAEIAELGAVYQTIKAGEASWRECLASKTGVEADGDDDPNAELRAKIADMASAGAQKRRKSNPGKAAPVDATAPTEAPGPAYDVDPNTGEIAPPAGES